MIALKEGYQHQGFICFFFFLPMIYLAVFSAISTLRPTKLLAETKWSKQDMTAAALTAAFSVHWQLIRSS